MLKIGSVVKITEITSYENVTRCKVQVYGISKDGKEFEDFKTFLTLFDKANELAVDLNVNSFIEIKDFGVTVNKSNGRWYTNINVTDAVIVEGKEVVINDPDDELPFS